VSARPGAMGNLEATLTYLIYRCGGGSTRKIAKLAYIADLWHYQKYGETATDVTYVRHLHGPYSDELEHALDRLESKGIICESPYRLANGRVAKLRKPALRNTKVRLPERVRETLDEVVEAWAKRDAEAIVEYARASAPYRAAGKPFAPLDFSATPRLTDPSLAHLRPLLDVQLETGPRIPSPDSPAARYLLENIPMGGLAAESGGCAEE